MSTHERMCSGGLHLYPGTVCPVPPGTQCRCGVKTWADAPHRRPAGRLTPGSRVAVIATGDQRVVVEKLRGEDAYRLDASVKGRVLYERAELISVL